MNNKQLQQQNKQLKNQVKQLKATRSRRGGTRGVPIAFPNRNWNSDAGSIQKGKEPVGEITPTSTGFNLALDYRINPADPLTFPWLSPIAQRYEKYKFRKLIVKYYPGVATTTGGTICFGFDYDVKDSAPNNWTSARQYYNKQSSPYAPCTWEISLKDNRWLFTSSEIPSGTDPKTYDFGRLFVSTYGCPANTTVGYVELEYEVEFDSMNPGSSPDNNVSYSSVAIYKNSNPYTMNGSTTSVDVKSWTLLRGDELTSQGTGGLTFKGVGLYLVTVGLNRFAGAAADEYGLSFGYGTTTIASGNGTVVNASKADVNGTSLSTVVYIKDTSDLSRAFFLNIFATYANTAHNIASGDIIISIVKLH